MTDNNGYVTILLTGSKIIFKINNSIVESKPVGSCLDSSSCEHGQVWSPGHEHAQAAGNPKFSSLQIVKYKINIRYLVIGLHETSSLLASMGNLDFPSVQRMFVWIQKANT